MRRSLNGMGEFSLESIIVRKYSYILAKFYSAVIILKRKLEKRSIVLKCKYCWSTNVTKPKTETAKRQKGKAEPEVFWKACLNP